MELVPTVINTGYAAGINAYGTVVLLNLIPHALPIVLSDAQHHHALNATPACLADNVTAVGVEVFKVEMGVGVDQLHGALPG